MDWRRRFYFFSLKRVARYQDLKGEIFSLPRFVSITRMDGEEIFEGNIAGQFDFVENEYMGDNGGCVELRRGKIRVEVCNTVGLKEIKQVLGNY